MTYTMNTMKTNDKKAMGAVYQAPRLSLRTVMTMPLCASEGSSVTPYTETEFDWN